MSVSEDVTKNLLENILIAKGYKVNVTTDAPGFIVEREITRNTKIKRSLSKASKNLTDKLGAPDTILMNPLIFSFN